MDLRIISLIIVMGAFLALLVWAYWPGNRARFEHLGKSILDESSPESGDSQ